MTKNFRRNVEKFTKERRKETSSHVIAHLQSKNYQKSVQGKWSLNDVGQLRTCMPSHQVIECRKRLSNAKKKNFVCNRISVGTEFNFRMD